MKLNNALSNVFRIDPLAAPLATIDSPMRAVLVAIEADGTLVTKMPQGLLYCDCLEAPSGSELVLAAGESVLVLLPLDGDRGVVLGRVGRYRAPHPAALQTQVTIEATESLTLKCGDSSIDLRADGRLMVRGKDVLLRARGRQRIKAGTVNIN